VTGLARSGTNLIGPNKDNLVHGINLLESTTRLLMKYNPELTCTLVGGKNVLDFGFLDVAGGANGYSVILDVALLFGDDTYRFPENLPINGAKGGPGGQPGCGSLPDVSKNFPQRYLVTNTGWGTGMDVRPNPGIGFPGYVAAVRPRRNTAVSWLAASASPGQATRTWPAAGRLGAVRPGGAGRTASDVRSHHPVVRPTASAAVCPGTLTRTSDTDAIGRRDMREN
jgi:hypothetical protein